MRFRKADFWSQSTTYLTATCTTSEMSRYVKMKDRRDLVGTAMQGQLFLSLAYFPVVEHFNLLFFTSCPLPLIFVLDHFH